MSWLKSVLIHVRVAYTSKIFIISLSLRLSHFLLLYFFISFSKHICLLLAFGLFSFFRHSDSIQIQANTKWIKWISGTNHPPFYTFCLLYTKEYEWEEEVKKIGNSCYYVMFATDNIIVCCVWWHSCIVVFHKNTFSEI